MYEVTYAVTTIQGPELEVTYEADIKQNCGYCGDGIVDESAGEECDDGNDIEVDACSSACVVPEYFSSPPKQKEAG